MNRFIIVLLTTLAVLAAPAPRPALAQENDNPQALRLISFDELMTLDPQKMSWMSDIRIAECLWEPLVRIKMPDLSLEPGLAEKWEVSPDGLTYTFHIRKEAKWSNGDPVTASDLVYAWRRAMLPDLAADYTQLMFAIKGAEDFFNWRTRQLAVYTREKDLKTPEKAAALWQAAEARFKETVGLSAPDDDTLIVKLAAPTAYFPELCAFATYFPVHAKTVEAMTKINADTGMKEQDPNWTKAESLVTNGPFILKRWRFKRDLYMEANPQFWNKAAVTNPAILQKVVADHQTALLSFQRGEADWIPDFPTAKSLAADLVAQGRPDVHSEPAAGTYFYNFNCQEKLNDGKANPLADARVRRALSMAIDRQAIVKKITRLRQPVARTFTPPGSIPGYQPPVEVGVDLDAAAAKKLLADAGYPDGKGLTGLSILYNPEGGHEAVAQAIKDGWQRHLGVVVSLETAEKRVFGERMKKRDYTICRAGWFGDYRDPTTFLDKMATGNGNNDAGYSNPAFDKLLKQAANEPDAKKRWAVLAQAEALMLADQPCAFIYQYTNLMLYDPAKVTGIVPNAWGRQRLELVTVKR